jgi:hypothetical protein
MKDVLKALKQKRASIDKAIAALDDTFAEQPRRRKTSRKVKVVRRARAKMKVAKPLKSRLSRAARKAQSLRMKKRWAKFRREKEAGSTPRKVTIGRNKAAKALEQAAVAA